MRQAPRPNALNVKIFKNSDQEVITKSKNHPTHGLEGRQDVVFHCSIETKLACCWLVSLSTQGFLFSGPFAWALALVKPNTSGFTQGAPGFPIHILHHAGSFITSNQIRRSTRCVASCELPGLPGEQHGKICFGTMLHELSVLFHIGLFFQWQNL